MTEKIVKEKEQQMDEMSDKLGKAEMENVQLREEVNIYKGRCTNLARDVELHYNEMHKLNNDSAHSGQQVHILLERVKNLESDVEVMRQ